RANRPRILWLGDSLKAAYCSRATLNRSSARSGGSVGGAEKEAHPEDAPLVRNSGLSYERDVGLNIQIQHGRDLVFDLQELSRTHRGYRARDLPRIGLPQVDALMLHVE